MENEAREIGTRNSEINTVLRNSLIKRYYFLCFIPYTPSISCNRLFILTFKALCFLHEKKTKQKG
jgi:hypothetical protein